MATEYHGGSIKAVVRDLGKTKSGKQKAAKEARKIVEMKGKQIKDELSLAMIQLFTKLLDDIELFNSVTGPVRSLDCQQCLAAVAVRCYVPVQSQTSTTVLV